MKIKIIILFIFICPLLKGQTLLESRIMLPDSLYKEIQDIFLSEGEEKVPKGAIIIANLISNDFSFKDGIYSYRMRSVHSLQRLIFVHNNHYYVCKSYDVTGVLKDFIIFIKKENICETLQIKYLLNISRFFNTQLGIINDTWDWKDKKEGAPF